jgi:hypothetical protein
MVVEMNIFELIAIRRHNAAIEKKWREDGRPIVSTTMGWRRDPWNKQDGYKDNGDGSYSKLIRGGTEEYRKQFERDVEEASK